MDVLIKSFNRVYYLDRAIYSLKKHLKGDYKIKVLDDGTPEQYLIKIKEKYPDIEIIHSQSSLEKQKAISENIKNGSEINGFKIPTQLWKNAVKNASQYFIMTEDDVWLTKDINLDLYQRKMHEYNIVLVKLGWISNRKISSKQLPIESTDLIAIIPKIFTAPRYIMNSFFDNKFKLFSFLYRLKLVDNNTKNEYWTLNSLLMGIYNKEYWLHIWDGLDGKVNEILQIKNAVQWYRKNKKNKYNFTKLNTLKMNTTFISSATNSYHQYNINCDINKFNHIMNEAWYNNQFDSLQNFPKDISESYYSSFLNKKNDSSCTEKNWKKWAEKFKEQYRKQEVNVD